MWLVLSAALGGTLLTFTLKFFFDRERPDSALPPGDRALAEFSQWSCHALSGGLSHTGGGANAARTEQGNQQVLHHRGAHAGATYWSESRVFRGALSNRRTRGMVSGVAWALLCWVVARSAPPRSGRCFEKTRRRERLLPVYH